MGYWEKKNLNMRHEIQAQVHFKHRLEAKKIKKLELSYK